MTTEKEKDLTPLQKSVIALNKIRQELNILKQDKNAPVAIIGMSCRFPGNANDPKRFWETLVNKKQSIVDLPPNRWNYSGNEQVKGGFINGIDEFDSLFFNISPKEAVNIDPQQRLLLELSYCALENAGYDINNLYNSNTGVFVGIGSFDHALRIIDSGIEINSYFGTGNALSAAAGRLSYFLGLQGPSLSVDTACSSSLVSIHLAVQSLRRRESNLALAGGVNVILSPELMVNFSKAGMLSSVGRCQTFDAGADGYVRGEGCGMVVLKRLDDAEHDGDIILGVIRSSVMNQDGASGGLTIPNGVSQRRLLRQALAEAGVSGDAVDYVEAHGTGTPLGDPIEMEALGEVYGGDRDKAHALLVGSVKTNIGHLESAAGVAGVIKLVLSLLKETIPAHLHFKTPNPHINWAALPVSIPVEAQPWKRGARRRLGGVSAFGFSGTNAHVLIEEAPVRKAVACLWSRPFHIFTVSGKTQSALENLLLQYRTLLTDAPASYDISSLCYTGNTGRTHFGYRLSFVAANRDSLLASLNAYIAPNTITPTPPEASLESIAFVFSGQGSQYAAMCRSLYQHHPLFRDTISECSAVLKTFDSNMPGLEDLLYLPENASLIDETAYTQPCLFAIEYAICLLLQHWGVKPAIVLGHSLGEYVAATVAGIFTLKEALQLVRARGQLMEQLCERGSMLSVYGTEQQVSAYLSGHEQQVSIAAINAAGQVVISGHRQTVDRIASSLSAGGVRSIPLTVSHGFHSPLMQPMLEAFGSVAAGIRYQLPNIKIISNLTGAVVTTEMSVPSYWVSHVMSTVRFADGIAALKKFGVGTCLEIGPRAVLSSLLLEQLGTGVNVMSVLSGRGIQDDWKKLLGAVSQLYNTGYNINWKTFNDPYNYTKTILPNYPFQRQKFWLPNRHQVHTNSLTGGHPLLGTGYSIASVAGGMLYTGLLDTERTLYLSHHRIGQSIWYPASGYMEMAIYAGRILGEGYAVTGLQIERPLVLHEAEVTEIQLVSTTGVSGNAFTIYSRLGGGAWSVHASGKWVKKAHRTPAVVSSSLSTSVMEMITDKSEDVAAYYETLSLAGLHYGVLWQGLHHLVRLEDTVYGYLVLPALLEEAAAPYSIHPVLLDSSFHVLGRLLSGLQSEGMYVPTGAEEIMIEQGQVFKELYVKGTWVPCDVPGERMGEVLLYDTAGHMVGWVKGLRLKGFSATGLSSAQHLENHLYEEAWVPVSDPNVYVHKQSTRWCLCGANTALLSLIEEQLLQESQPVELINTATESHEVFNNSRMIYAMGKNEELWTLVALLQKIGNVPEAGLKHLYVLTENAEKVLKEDSICLSQSAVGSLLQVFRNEHPDLLITHIDHSGIAGLREVALMQDYLWTDGKEGKLAVRGRNKYVCRLVKTHLASGSMSLVQTSIGILEGLKRSSFSLPAPEKNEVKVSVQAAALNFKDILYALGLLERGAGDPGYFGFECAGTIVEKGAAVTQFDVGDDVLVCLAYGSMNSEVNAHADFVVKRPTTMNAAEGATLPVAYLTAYYGLVQCGKLQKGERVLIHAGAGGVGQAAIQLARYIGAEVFATCSEGKKEFLRSQGVLHIYDSRTTAYEREILADTAGQGVSVVLNSLSGTHIETSLAVCGKEARFIEIGKIGIKTAEELHAIRPDIRYHNYDIGELGAADPILIRTLLHQLHVLWQSGKLKALHYEGYDITEAAKGFRYLSQGKNIGKIVFTGYKPATPVKVGEDGWYLVSGGTGGLGWLSVEVLLEMGARRVCIVSRGLHTPVDLEAKMASYKKEGKLLKMDVADLTDQASVAALINSTRNTWGRLCGIIHAAGIIDDGMIADMDRDRFENISSVKLSGARNLQRACEHSPVDFFICYSSVAAVLGSPGQSNYATANAAMDKQVAEWNNDGKHALTIQWGPWANHGMAARMNNALKERSQKQGIIFIQPEHGKALLNKLILSAQHGIITVLPVNWNLLAKQLNALKFASFSGVVTNSNAPEKDFMGMLEKIRNQDGQQFPLLINYLRNVLSNATEIPVAEIAGHSVINKLGVDSLMAVSIKNKIKKDLKIELNITRFLQGIDINELARDVIGLLRAADTAAPDPDEHLKIFNSNSALNEIEAKRVLQNLDKLADSDLDLLLKQLTVK